MHQEREQEAILYQTHALRKRTRSNLEPEAKPLCCQSVITAEKVKQKSKSRLGPVTRRVVIYKELMTGILSQEHCFVSDNKML